MDNEYIIRNYLILPYEAFVCAENLKDAKLLAMEMCREGFVEPNFDLAFWSEQSKVIEENISAIESVIDFVNKKEKTNNA